MKQEAQMLLRQQIVLRWTFWWWGVRGLTVGVGVKSCTFTLQGISHSFVQELLLYIVLFSQNA